MAERSDTSILAARYAAAWVAAVGSDGLNRLADEIAALAASLANDGRLARLLDDPTIPNNALASALKQVADGAGFVATTGQFLSVLAAAGRQSLLPKILTDVEGQIDRARGVQKARLVSAAPLPAAAVQELQTLLSQRLSAKVNLVTAVDEKLLGGLQVEMNSWLLDASLAGQLNRLERQLKDNQAA